MQLATSHSLRDSQTVGTAIKTTQSLDDYARPHRHASITSCVDRKNIQRWLEPLYLTDISPCHNRAFHVQKPMGRDITLL